MRSEKLSQAKRDRLAKFLESQGEIFKRIHHPSSLVSPRVVNKGIGVQFTREKSEMAVYL